MIASIMAPHSLRATTLSVLAAAVLVGGGCATYSEKLAHAHREARYGDYDGAVDTVNGLLEVPTASALPDDWNDNTGLTLLERAVLLQARQDHHLSARDLREADQALELLDLTKDPVGAIGKFIYSDEAGAYRTTPAEKLALNACNMLNYLALGDLAGAAVEARRFQVMRNYLEQFADGGDGRLGAYLAGFIFEQAGDADRALRYYDDALAGRPLRSLAGPVRRLAARSSYRGKTIQALLDEKDDAPPPPPTAELLVVVSVGRVPYKVPERMPAGLAIGIAGTLITGDADVLERLAGKVVVYPELVVPPQTAGEPSIAVDGRAATGELLVDQGVQVRREYERMKPMILAAALTRLLARAAVAEGVRAATRDGGDRVQVLASLATELTLVALDKPDTRSWTFLPGRVYVARVPVAPGAHCVTVRLPDGRSRTWTGDVPAGTAGVVVVTAPQ